jgi:hypothetical protein
MTSRWVAWACLRSWNLSFARPVFAIANPHCCDTCIGGSMEPSEWQTTKSSSDIRLPSFRSSWASRARCALRCCWPCQRSAQQRLETKLKAKLIWRRWMMCRPAVQEAVRNGTAANSERDKTIDGRLHQPICGHLRALKSSRCVAA